jgi:hypothetical protein
MLVMSSRKLVLTGDPYFKRLTHHRFEFRTIAHNPHHRRTKSNVYVGATNPGEEIRGNDVWSDFVCGHQNISYFSFVLVIAMGIANATSFVFATTRATVIAKAIASSFVFVIATANVTAIANAMSFVFANTIAIASASASDRATSFRPRKQSHHARIPFFAPPRSQ